MSQNVLCISYLSCVYAPKLHMYMNTKTCFCSSIANSVADLPLTRIESKYTRIL